MIEYYSNTGNERVGFVLNTGEVVEVDNVALQPDKAFMVSTIDLMRYEDIAVATWHTHPGESSNLSDMDYRAFYNWPHLKHYIIGKDGISAYVIKNGNLVKADDNNCPSWVSEDPL